LLSTENALIIITDALGREVMKTRATQKQIDLNLDREGIYFVTTISAEERTTLKLIVSR
jgi:hypothetical protein